MTRVKDMTDTTIIIMGNTVMTDTMYIMEIMVTTKAKEKRMKIKEQTDKIDEQEKQENHVILYNYRW